MMAEVIKQDTTVMLLNDVIGTFTYSLSVFDYYRVSLLVLLMW